MFKRVVLLAVLSLAVSLLVTLPGRTAAGFAGAPGLESAAPVAGAIDLFELSKAIGRHESGRATVSAPDDECCEQGLINPFLSCAPDCPMIPAQASAPPRDVSMLKSMATGPLAHGLPSGGIYRPPILIS